MKHSMTVRAHCDKIISCIMLAAIQFGDRNGQIALQEIAGSRLINLRQVQMTVSQFSARTIFRPSLVSSTLCKWYSKAPSGKSSALKLSPECCCFEKFAIFPYCTRNFMQLVFSSVEPIGNLIENRTDIGSFLPLL